MQESIVFLVHVQCRREERKFTFAISSPDEFLVASAIATRHEVASTTMLLLVVVNIESETTI